jgi:hypothetical protein
VASSAFETKILSLVTHDPSADRVINFTNDGVVVGPDPLKARLDLWKKVLDKGH